MFFQQLPEWFSWVILFGIGVATGSLINLAVYQLSFFRPRNISPWSAPAVGHPSRTWFDRIPVVGWFLLKREAGLHGARFWIRPALIELATGIGLVWFYHWQSSGGLFGHRIDELVAEQAVSIGSLTWTWFLFHSALLVLLTIATFIDFDDQTIPDWVTVPGTVFALVMLAGFPWLRLPEVRHEIGGIELSSLTSGSPLGALHWPATTTGLAIGWAIVLIWCFALIPKWSTLRFGLVRGVQIMMASIIRPRRKTVSNVPRIRQRTMMTQTRLFLVFAVVLSAAVTAVWGIGGPCWTALLDSLLGLAMGGGIVWAVRIVAGKALGVEAMGFGDVTLMCMIGAFTGWQPALLIFVIAPFTSIVVALVQLIAAGENRLAFGPYLCLATVIVLIGWNSIWNDWAAPGVFQVGGGFLAGVILVCLILMAGMLGVWSKIKNRFGER